MSSKEDYLIKQSKKAYDKWMSILDDVAYNHKVLRIYGFQSLDDVATKIYTLGLITRKEYKTANKYWEWIDDEISPKALNILYELTNGKTK